ncbi:helix-turn-helix transcriptional regulator [Streptococcus infantarius]|uniref:helix-turn-helix transcriptional regulator n=1 Tax=Streptococcus infantarius TaxID=102684 RepID=UPI0023A9B181|nr:helix-turn-helix transcriptional regulator [Streptococcus infantarius]
MNRLKELRSNAIHNGHKMRQADLAELLGVTKLTVSNWENGKHEIKSDKANEIAKLFNVSVSYLLGYSDKKEPYYSDEILLDNGSGGVSSLSFERHNDLQKEYSKQIRKDFINFLRSYDFVISDNEIKVLLEQISNLNISTLAHIDHERVIKQTNPKKYLIENGYKELGDLFQSNKGIENFYKEKGYDPESTL